MNRILQSDWFRERAEFSDLDRGQRNGSFIIIIIIKIKLYKFYGRSLSIVVCALFTLIFTPLRLPASAGLHIPD